MRTTIGFRGVGIDVDTPVSRLSGGERQGVAIGRAMHFDSDLIVLDEPTVALALKEVQKVLDFIRAHPNPGVSYEVWSFVPQTGSISEAQRVAFFRAAMTRNLLVKAGVPPKLILTQIRITDPKLPDGHNVRIVLKP